MSDAALVKLSAARLALAECKTVMGAKEIADAAQAARVYLERTNASVAAVNEATEIRILAERQMGDFLHAAPKATGELKVGTSKSPAVTGRYHGETPTLAEIGISKIQSSRAQKLAAIPERKVVETIQAIKERGDPLSVAALLRETKTPAPKSAVVVFPGAESIVEKLDTTTACGLMVCEDVIDRLAGIPARDREREAGFKKVADWIRTHTKTKRGRKSA